MCGINGMVFLNGVERSDKMMEKVRYVFDELMVETQDRGEHATGLASFKRDGSYEFHKNNVNADVMTTDDKEYRSIVSNLNSLETSVVIAHTRYLTKGKADNNNNNHPFDIGNIVGLHNGSAKNDDYLFSQYKDDFERIGEVDSEIVFQLINHYNRNDITMDGLVQSLETTKLRGLFALAFVHKNNTNLLHLVKQDKPMCIAYWKEAGIIIFNSIEEYVEKAFRKLERVGQTLGITDAKQTVKTLKVTADRYFTINADANNLLDAVGEENRLYIETTSYSYSSSSTTTTSNKYTANDSYKSNYQTVTTKDSKGLALQGEVDTVTGEVFIWSDDVTDADDGSGLADDVGIEPTCMECDAWLTDSELDSSYNTDNPKDESICYDCYQEVLRSFIDEDVREESTRVRY